MCLISIFLFSENSAINLNSNQQIFQLIKTNNTLKISQWLETVDEINFTDNNGENILFHVIRNKNNEILDKIIEKGISLNQINDQLSNALHIACKFSNAFSVKILLENDIDIEQIDIDGNKALFYAEQNSDIEIIILIKRYTKIIRKEKINSLDYFIKNFYNKAIDEME